MMTNYPFDQMDALEELNTCFEAIGDLMNTDCPIAEKQRDNLAVLLGYLHRQYCQALKQLQKEVKQVA